MRWDWRSDGRLLVYASGNFSKNLLWGAADVTLLYLLIEILHLGPMVSGVIFFASLLIDCALNLYIGNISQTLRSPLGRYGPFLVWGGPACALSFILVYALPILRINNVVLIGLSVFLFRACYALIDVPHNALLGRLSLDSKGRSRATGYRYGFSALASLMVANHLAPNLLLKAEGHPKDLLSVAVLFGVLSAVVLIASWYSVRREDKIQESGGISRTKLNIFSEIIELFKSKMVFKIGIIASLIGLFAPIFHKLCLFYVQYGLKADLEAAEILSLIVFGQLLGVGLWILVSQRAEKSTTLALALMCAAGGLWGLYLGLAESDLGLRVSVFIFGIGLSGVYALPWAMVGDVVDFHHWRAGRRCEGLIFALVVVLMKLGIAFGSLCVAGTLGLFGFHPGPVQAPHIVEVLRSLALLVPAIGLLLTAGYVLSYRLSHRLLGHVQGRLGRI